MFGKAFLFGLQASILVFNNRVLGQSCDRCNFDGEDAADCKDYGLINNSDLIAWEMASEECMATFDIQITSPDPTLICGSASSFVNELRFGSSLTTARLGLGVAEGGFFDDDGLKSQITIGGQDIDCEASESDCYNAMKDYFDSDPNGQAEMDDVCGTLQNAVIKDRQLEQSTIRNRLCQESVAGTAIPDSCSPLWEQLEAKMQEYPDETCAGFAMGTQNMAIPGCDDDDGSREPVEGSGSVRVSSIFVTLVLGALVVIVF